MNSNMTLASNWFGGLIALLLPKILFVIILTRKLAPTNFALS